MRFERLFLTKSSEFYHFTIDYDTIAYLLILDTFSKAPKSFGDQFYDEEFEPNDNWIIVKCAVLKELTEEERAYVLSFLESLLGFKASIDYVVDFFPITKEIEFDYPKDQGFFDLIQQVNQMFDTGITIKEPSSFNHLIQF